MNFRKSANTYGKNTLNFINTRTDIHAKFLYTHTVKLKFGKRFGHREKEMDKAFSKIINKKKKNNTHNCYDIYVMYKFKKLPFVI